MTNTRHQPPRLLLSQASSSVESSSKDDEPSSPSNDCASSQGTINTCLSYETVPSEEESDDNNEKRIPSHPASKDQSTMRLRGGIRSSFPQKTEQWMQLAWIVHFLVGASVLLFSVYSNGGNRKYIPVDPSFSSQASGMQHLEDCQKVFVNVLAASPDDPGAVICCDDPASTASVSTEFLSPLLNLCPSSNEPPLPFLGRLAKFPDAWLIPLFPLLLRIGFRTYQTLLERGHLVLDTTFGVYSFRRLVFYFLLMQFRGWVLYVALNSIEDNYLNEDADPSNCWYQTWLPSTLAKSTPVCRGRKFDFSDHVVLYYAQILPIALLEALHSLNRPYWPFHFFRRIALPILLTMGMCYLYFITFLGVIKTATYFHTPNESLAGYGVSLLAHLPLCTLQCHNGPKMASLREYFFGHKPLKKILA